MLILATAFLVTSMIYASVGFGGGSTYNALLILSGADYQILPLIALTCNLIVVSGGCYRFYRAGFIDIKRMLPWAIASVPAAWYGGYMDVSEIFFTALLACVLFASAIWMLKPANIAVNRSPQTQNMKTVIAVIGGGGLGFVAGMVGIGGGIFLAPLLYAINWARPKQIAAACCLFIFINSMAGLLGQMMKLPSSQMMSAVADYGFLWLAVLIGGQIGAFLGATYLPAKWVKLLTALLILYVAIRLFWRLACLLF